MLIKKKVSPKGEWAKVGNDIMDGDAIIIKNDGEEVVGDYGKRMVFKVETRNGEKNLSLNQTSLNALVDAYGEDTSLWVGKKANVYIIKANVAGKFVKVVYLVGIGWEFTDEGMVVKRGEANDIDGDSVADSDLPEIKIEDIPF